MLSGCASQQASQGEELPSGALNRTALRASRPRSIALAKTRSVVFDGSIGGSMTPGGALNGAIAGAIGAEPPGDYTATLLEYRIQDPVIAIRRSIVARMARRFGLSVVSEEEAGGEVGAPVATDLALAIDTQVWGIIPTRARHYGIRYRGSLQLTDNRTHRVIAEGTCIARPVDGDDSPTMDELRANEGALLKASLAATAEYCIDDYRKRVLGLY